MPNVVTVTFEGNHKRYYFGSIPNLEVGKYAVVETARGIEVGKIVQGEMEVSDDEVVGELKNVIRQATDKDMEAYLENQALKPELYEEVKSILTNYKELEMKLLEVTYTLDRSKLIIYFTSDGRVDFRELVKEIAYKYHTRIELRQVGPRDASRIISGIGECGRIVCCSEWLGDIQNVTIKMAKNQNLSLNPTTISGLCGKLLCCIAYEDELYQEKIEGLDNPIPNTELSQEDSLLMSEELKEIIEENKPVEDNKKKESNNNQYNNSRKPNRFNNNNSNQYNKPYQKIKENKTSDDEVVKIETAPQSNETESKPNENNNNRPNRNYNNNFKHHHNNKNKNLNNKNRYKKNKNNSNNDKEETIRIEV